MSGAAKRTRGRYPPPNEREPGKESRAREKRNKIDVLQLPAKRTARAIYLPSSCAAALLTWGFFEPPLRRCEASGISSASDRGWFVLLPASEKELSIKDEL